MADAKAAQADEHERDVEDREAFEAWGYMFKPDKTGTDKLKALLRGLKNVIVCIRRQAEATESSVEFYLIADHF